MQMDASCQHFAVWYICVHPISFFAFIVLLAEFCDNKNDFILVYGNLNILYIINTTTSEFLAQGLKLSDREMPRLQGVDYCIF